MEAMRHGVSAALISRSEDGYFPGGAVTTTLLGLFFVPLYFVVILRLFRVKPLKAAQAK